MIHILRRASIVALSSLLWLGSSRLASAQLKMSDFSYLIDAANILAETDLKGDALSEKDALGVANTMCKALSQLSEDKNFDSLVRKYASQKIEPKEKEEFEAVLRNIGKFAQFAASDHELLRKAGLSERASDMAIGLLWSLRSEIAALKIEHERVLAAVKKAAAEVCKNKDAVKSSVAYKENRNYFLKVVGGAIFVVNSVVSFGGVVFALLSIAGGLVGVVLI